MPKVLTIEPGSIVNCGHDPGKVQTVSTAPLTVNTNAVLLESSIDGKSVDGCSTAPAVDGSGTSTAITCKLAGPPPAITAGWATKLTVGGKPVILDTLKGQTNGMVLKVQPQQLLNGEALHDKLTAD